MEVSTALTDATFLSDIRVWPAELKVDSRRWLRNFTPREKEYAEALLNAFLYLSSQLTDRLFTAAVESITPEVIGLGADYEELKGQWQLFHDTVIVTHPTGEVPNPTDSGYTFDRKARQLLGVSQNRILSPEHAVDHLTRNTSAPVLFLDDFVGSGDQFCATWNRIHTTPDGPHSFASLAARTPAGVYFYCPLVCTTTGADAIHAQCPQVRIRPAHVLDPEYGARHANSVVWPDTLRPGAVHFIESASQRAGIPQSKWWGYDELGLTLAFEHGVPDATLPLLYWDQNGWNPLVVKR